MRSDAPPEAAELGIGGGRDWAASRAFGVGIVMAFRPKNLLLATVVGLQLHVGAWGPRRASSSASVYVVLATSTVTVPIMLTTLSRRRGWSRGSGAASQDAAADGPIVSAVVLIVIGLVVIGAGLQTV